GSIGLNVLIRSVEGEDRPCRDQSQALGASLAQISFDDAREVAGYDHATHQLTRLAEVNPTERGAVAEPEREPVARLTRLVRLRAPRGALGDHLHERLAVARRRDRGWHPAGGQWRLTAPDVDSAHLAGDVVDVGRDLRARIPPGLIEEDAVFPHGRQPEVGRVAADRVHPGARREKRRARVDPVRASTEILAERAFDDGELGSEIL